MSCVFLLFVAFYFKNSGFCAIFYAKFYQQNKLTEKECQLH
ncbi:hypothetical protein MHA_1124 [Mannheimia haemolytica PHL213]|nr:hypothetical protein MHA_1124 [Mannheimia haemolytica PHL213]EEY09861.1 hypothetical protein COI_1514 [Mannheimia haemolytica serotype A2 str. OVINE]